MKKFIFYILFITSYLYAQENLYNSYTDYRREFNDQVDYIITKDCYFEFWETLDFYRKSPANSGTVVSNKDDTEFSGFGLLYTEPNGCVSADNLKISNSDCFDDYIVYKSELGEKNLRWVPFWYFEAIECKERDIILEAEPKRKNNITDINVSEWYIDKPQISSLVISNTGLMLYSPVYVKNTGFLLKYIKNKGQKIEVLAIPSKTDEDLKYVIKRNSENFPHLENGNPVKFNFEIDGKIMKIYNGETNKLCMELIQMPAEWVKLYETFIRTNNVPAGLDLPKEYLERSRKK